MTPKTKRIILIVSIVILLFIVIGFIYLFYLQKKTTNVQTGVEEGTVTTSDIYAIDEGTYGLSQNKNEVKIDYENKIIEQSGTQYNIGDLKNAYPIFVFSPNNKYAVGRFFKIEDDQYYYYLLSQNNPQKLGDEVEGVGMVFDDGTMIYFMHGEIRRGNPITDSYTVLVNSEDVSGLYISFAQIDNSTLLYWGLPTDVSGLNMYELNVDSGVLTDIITDNTVTDAKLSNSKDKLIVERYIEDSAGNGEYSTWLFSLTSKEFIKKLPVYFRAYSCAWSPDDTEVAYWNGTLLSTINLDSEKTTLINNFSSDSVYPGKMLNYSNNQIIILSR